MRHAIRSRSVPSAFRVARVSIRLIGGIGAVLCVLAAVTVYGLSATNTARLVPVMSNSMAPGMAVGSLALTLPVSRDDIRVGDVIVFTDPDHPTIRVIHRIIHIYGPDEASSFTNWVPNQLIASTKGDNNPQADPWTVTVSDATIWRLDRSLPYLGEPAMWFENPSIRLWGFGAGGAALIGWILVIIWRRPSAESAEAAEPTVSLESVEPVAL
jgi:signal peptidase